MKNWRRSLQEWTYFPSAELPPAEASAEDLLAVDVPPDERARRMSDVFFGRFLTVWNAFGVVLLVYSFAVIPESIYFPLAMLAAGAISFGLLKAGRWTPAKGVLVLVMFCVIVVAPWYINGIRTPVIANTPLLLVLTAWLLGRRVMVTLAGALLVAFLAIWQAEAQALVIGPAPLREPHVWYMVFTFNMIFGIVIIGALIGSYEANLMREATLARQLRELAFHDPLTGLTNRRLFLEHLRKSVDQSRRSGQWGAVLLLDLDGFKSINDGHGHEAGDLILAAMASRIRTRIRASDTASRFGGDEFTILLTNLGMSEPQARANAETFVAKLRARLAEPIRIGEVEHRLRCSIGLSLVSGRDGEDAAGLLRCADVDMYAMKKGAAEG